MHTIKEKLKIAVMLILCCSMGVSNVLAQNASYPWAQDVEYDYGIMPDGKDEADAMSAYTQWKKDYVVDAMDGTKRVKWDSFSGFTRGSDVNSVSEGIAYGMLLSAYAADKATFDGLWAYYQKFYTWNTVENGDGSGFRTHIMNWKTCNPSPTQSYVDADGSCSDGSTPGTGGATDAEFDAAMALIVASYQWPTDPRNYDNSAKILIKEIRQLEFLDNGIMKPGDSWRDNQDITNISYFSPAYYRIFAEYDDADFWNRAVEQCYTILNKAVTNDGLVPDWCSKNGTKSAYQDDFEEDGEAFLYDAVRTPLRIAVDYLWFNESRAKTYCDKTTAFAINKGGVAALDAGYFLNGNPVHQNSNNNPTFMGCFSVGGMVSNNQAFVNTSYNALVNTPAEDKHYFDATIRTLSLFIMSGNFYMPPPDACQKPELGEDVSLCSGAITLNTGLSSTNRTFEWYKGVDKVQGQTGPTLSLTTGDEGTYRVISDSSGCVRSDVITVYQDELVAEFTFEPNTNNNLEVFFTDASLGMPVDYNWTFDGTSGITEQNPVFDFGNPGLYLATLEIENECGETDDVTKEITIGTTCTDCPGWAADQFGTGFQWNTVGVWAEGSLTLDIDNSCTDYKVSVNKATVKQYAGNSVTIKDGGDDAPIDISNYPYAKFKIKVDKEMDSLRVDLQTIYNPGAKNPDYVSNDKTPVYLKGERNPDGSYKKIPANQWIVSTLDYTDKWDSWNSKYNVDPTSIAAMVFQMEEAATRENKSFALNVDWIAIGNAQIEKPQPDGGLKTTYSACSGETVEVDVTTCNVETYAWAHGPTTPVVELGPGTYNVTISNYGGDTTLTFSVVEQVAPVAGFEFEEDGLTVDFTNLSSGATNYSWNFDGGAASSSLENPSATFSGSDTYNVCLTATNACDSDVKCIEIALCEKIGEAVITGGAEVCKTDGCVSYTVADVDGATNYRWSVTSGAVICGVQGSTELTVDFKDATVGVIEVVGVTPLSGCAEGVLVEKNVKVKDCTITGVSSYGKALTFGPNPATNVIHFNQEVSGTVLDSEGTVITTLKGRTLNVSQFNAGLYFIKGIDQSNVSFNHKFVVE